MSKLDEFKAQHPEYKEWPDQELADALHNKYYSDVPKDKFYTDIGLTSAKPKKTDPITLGKVFKDIGDVASERVAKLQKDATTGGFIPSAVKSAFDVVDILGSPAGGLARSVGQESARQGVVPYGAPKIIPHPNGQLYYSYNGEPEKPVPLNKEGKPDLGLLMGQNIQEAYQKAHRVTEQSGAKSNEELANNILSLVPLGEGGQAKKAVAKGEELAKEVPNTLKNLAPTYEEQLFRRMYPDKGDAEWKAGAERLEKEHGIKLTPGSRVSAEAKTKEELHTSNPFIGPAIKQQQKEAAHSFIRATYNEVLKPLGEKVPEAIPTDVRGVAHVKERIKKAYDEVVPHIRAVLDEEAKGRMVDAFQNVPLSQRDEFMRIIKTRLGDRIGADGSFVGQKYKDIESDLNRLATGYKGSTDTNQRYLGEQLDNVLHAIRDSAERYTPAEHAFKLKKSNEAYAKYTRLRDAAASARDGMGEFTPQQLVSATKRGDKTVGKGGFATGEALMQDFASLAQKYVPNKTPNSFTTDRYLANTLGAGALGGSIGHFMGPGVGDAVGSVLGAGVDMAARKTSNALFKGAMERQAKRAAGTSEQILSDAHGTINNQTKQRKILNKLITTTQAASIANAANNSSQATQQ